MMGWAGAATNRAARLPPRAAIVGTQRETSWLRITSLDIRNDLTQSAINYSEFVRLWRCCKFAAKRQGSVHVYLRGQEEFSTLA